MPKESTSKKESYFYHFNNGISFKEDKESGEFYSEGFIATTHPDKYGDIIPKGTLAKIAEKIKNNQIGRNMFYPTYASIRHDWIDMENKQFKNLPIAGKAVDAELRQLNDGQFGVWVSTHHNKEHPDYEKTKYNVIHGYYPGYSIEYNTISEHKEGSYNFLDDIELLGYGFADGRFIANPHAAIENYGFKEYFKENSEELKMETENALPKIDEVNYKELYAKSQDEIKTKEAKLKEFEDAKVKELEAVKAKEDETRLSRLVESIVTKQMPSFVKFDAGAQAVVPEVKEYFTALKAGTLSTKEMSAVVNRFPEIIYGQRANKKEIFDCKLKSMVEGLEPYIGTYDISLGKVGVKALTAYNSPSNDEATYYQAPAELGDVYDPMLISQLNDQTIFLGIVPKEDLSNRQNIQFRAKTAYGTPGGFVEGDSTWTATNTTRVKCEQNFAYWRETYEVTNQMKIASAAAGGIGPVLTMEIQDAGINMMKDINSKILTGAAGTYDGATGAGYYLISLQHICGNTGNLYGKARSSLTWLKAQTPDATAESISLNIMRKMMEYTMTAPADARRENLVFVTSLRQERLLKSVLQKAQGGFVPYSARIGFQGNIDIDGVPVFADGQADTDDLFLVDMSHLRFAIQKAPSVTKMGITGDTEKGFVTIYFNLYSTKPLNNMWHSALST